MHCAAAAGRGVHVIFGAGQVGTLVAAQLAAAGQRVRMVRRAGPAPASAVQLPQGDLAEPVFRRRAVSGARVNHHCASPAYAAVEWGRMFPR
jgi:nucleoside-diphosphate-sugar epimerase